LASVAPEQRLSRVSAKVIRTVFRSTQYQLISQADVSAMTGISDFFRSFIRFQPIDEADVSTTASYISMSNSSTQSPQIVGIFPPTEFEAWSQLYTKFKVTRIHLQYTPAMTMGVSTMSSSQQSSLGKLLISPVIEDLTPYLDSASNLLVPTPTNIAYTRLLQAPHSSTKSFYTKTSMSIQPVFFQSMISEGISTNLMARPVRVPWFDLENQESPPFLDGFYLSIPGLKVGGYSTTFPGSIFPATVNSVVVFGVVDFLFEVEFKDRL